MVRILIVAVVGLGVILGMYMIKDYHNQTKITALITENNALKGNNKFMEEKIEKEYQKTLEISERNKKLEKEALHDKVFDWNIDISHSLVIKRLQEN